MKVTGFAYLRPLRIMNGPALTPSPRMKRSSKSSANVRAAAPVAIASRFHTLAIAVPTTIPSVAFSRWVAITNGSRPKVSGTHNTE
jgi:hypothetical protein